MSVKPEYSKIESEVYFRLLRLCEVPLKAEFGPFFLSFFKEVEYPSPIYFTSLPILQIDKTAEIRG